MGIAVLVSTGRPEALKRLSGETFNIWLDVLGELKEVMEPSHQVFVHLAFGSLLSRFTHLFLAQGVRAQQISPGSGILIILQTHTSAIRRGHLNTTEDVLCVYHGSDFSHLIFSRSIIKIPLGPLNSSRSSIVIFKKRRGRVALPLLHTLPARTLLLSVNFRPLSHIRRHNYSN